MFRCRPLATRLALVSALAVVAGPGFAQFLNGPPADPAFRFSTPTPSGVVIPDTVDTRFGALRFSGGETSATKMLCHTACEPRCTTLPTYRIVLGKFSTKTRGVISAVSWVASS